VSETNSTLRIGLAAVRNAATVEERLHTLDSFVRDAATQGVAIVCFPEAYIPGLRGFDFQVPPVDQRRQEAALETIRDVARRHGVWVVVGMEWESANGLLNVAFVVSRDGQLQGYQAKNQIAPEEEPFYVPDGQRRLFAIDDVPFGIAICHEGWRYPESVRWAAARGARLIFHPQLTGSDIGGITIARWGDPQSPYYEKAMIARSIENSIYFASVNYAMRFQDSATTLIGPDGDCLAYIPYGQEGLLVYDLDLTRASGFYALRFNSALYPPT
jgi:predicted amidohydrolase